MRETADGLLGEPALLQIAHGIDFVRPQARIDMASTSPRPELHRRESVIISVSIGDHRPYCAVCRLATSKSPNTFLPISLSLLQPVSSETR